MKNLKKIITILVILILLIFLGIFIYKYSTDEIYRVNLFDKDANKSFNNIIDTKYGIDEQGYEKLKENINMNNYEDGIVHDYIFGQHGLYGDLITEESMKNYDIELTDENKKEMDSINNDRIQILKELQKCFIDNNIVEVVDTKIENDILYKTVKIKPIEEIEFRMHYYNLANRIFFKYMEIEDGWGNVDTFYEKKYSGKLFEIAKSKNKALSVLLDNIDDYYTDEMVEFTLQFIPKDNHWVLNNFSEFTEECAGLNAERTNVSIEDLDKLYEERETIPLELYNKYIKDLNEDDLFNINI